MNRTYRMLSFVPRWGIAPRHHQQSVAEHSYYVTLYAAQLCEMMSVSNYGRLLVLEYALVHDVYEAWTSDIPGPAKRSLVDSKRLEEYHTQFAAQMDSYYRGTIITGVETVSDGYGAERRIKDIVKVADLLDSVFYLKAEVVMGNNFALGLFYRDMERLGKAASNILVGDVRVDFGAQLQEALNSMELTGAVLPVVDSDLPEPPFDVNTGWDPD